MEKTADFVHFLFLFMHTEQAASVPCTATRLQVELLSGMALTFQDTNGSTGSGTLTSSGTYLTTANFTGSGSFEAVVVPSITNTTDCGAYTNPLIELAVLVTSLDATVSIYVLLHCLL